MCLLGRLHFRKEASEPQREKTYFRTSAPREDSDQPAHSPSPIKIFSSRILITKSSKFLRVDSEYSYQTAQIYSLNRFQVHEFTISTSRIHDFNFTKSRIQLHEFTNSTSHKFTNSTSRIHEFNFKNSILRIHEFNFTNSRFQLHEFNFINSRLQLHEFNS